MSDIQRNQDAERNVDSLLADIKDIAEQFIVASQMEDAGYVAQLKVKMGQKLSDLMELFKAGGGDDELLAKVKDALCDDVIMKWLSFLGVEGKSLIEAVSRGMSDFREASIDDGVIPESIGDDSQVLKNYSQNPFLSKFVTLHLRRVANGNVIETLRKRATLAPLIGEFGFMQQDYDLSLRLKRYFSPDPRRHADSEIVEGKKGFAILHIDLDGFKLWNDTFAKLENPHKYGDAVLRVIARSISGILRLNDIKKRNGGDELIIVLDEISSREDALAKADEIRCIVEGLTKDDFRAELGDDVDRIELMPEVRQNAGLQKGFASLSIGVVTFFNRGVSVNGDQHSFANRLVGIADTLVYAVKEHGKNGIAFLDGSNVVIRRFLKDGVVSDESIGDFQSIKSQIDD
ncbi:MAG: hypothetical protein ACD_65C00296G0002 [uncultured bacterium]|nr:MAG: hypothetical protein ACD_65C00296G0002 [uncultured bacterium]KKT02336.1 MAG: diguanylate cyclase [Candidatus Peregrinibacteria bacterium GW2011_GWF2_43_17]KKT20323.1 MAG: hypothetical protein UW03_C0006G0058 [Candidatus Peregrinibacteria bacterium GW2011_GWA2_43_8]HAU39421.1 hypothetical protein [Candidatus Peregrinibacteria bacterium]